MSEPILSMKNVTMKFGGVTALNDVSFDPTNSIVVHKNPLGSTSPHMRFAITNGQGATA